MVWENLLEFQKKKRRAPARNSGEERDEKAVRSRQVVSRLLLSLLFHLISPVLCVTPQPANCDRRIERRAERDSNNMLLSDV